MSVIRRITEKLPESSNDVTDHYVVRNIRGGVSKIMAERVTRYAAFVLLGLLLLGLFGPAIAPHDYNDQHRTADGELDRLSPPSADHWLGTTERGEDVLSRVLYGAQPTIITGFVGGLLIIGIGLSVGITAGYVGGRTEEVIMRLVDFVYGVPLIPTALVLLAVLGTGFWSVILIISLILWRGSARVLRSQVLQIKERPYIQAAKATGASDTRIVFKHILPNIASMAILFFALGVGIAIVKQAGLAFLGVTDPFIPSWGIMIRNAYESGFVADAWWWTLPAGFLIGLTVLSTFLLGRGYESTGTSSEGGI